MVDRDYVDAHWCRCCGADLSRHGHTPGCENEITFEPDDYDDAHYEEDDEA